jgi:hypothetical protein
VKLGGLWGDPNLISNPPSLNRNGHFSATRGNTPTLDGQHRGVCRLREVCCREQQKTNGNCTSTGS